MGGRYTFIVPIGLYLIFLGYLVATQEKFVVEKIDSGVELLPSQLKDLANILLQQKQLYQALGGVYAFAGFCILIRMIFIVKFFILIQAAFVGVLISVIVIEKPIMQELSEQLERVAYQLCILGMFFIAAAQHYPVEKQVKKVEQKEEKEEQKEKKQEGEGKAKKE